MHCPVKRLIVASFVATVAMCAVHPLSAQDDPFGGPQITVQSESGAAPVIVHGGGVYSPGSSPGPAVMAVPPGAKPPGAKKEEKADNEDGEDKKDDKGKSDANAEEELPTIVKRPMEPSEEPDPSELEATPDANGNIRFSFRGQKWPAVLDWLAHVSEMSLDWQELPGDYLNLVTQREYSLDEARDLINRHLLARGFTMLVNGEVLSVVKTEGINAGLVPRVEPEQLADCMPHEFLKVSFRLDWLVAEAVVEELKPMISPNGKLTALSGTNRLEAMDAAANLREIYDVLQEEQSAGSQERLVQEFVLKHARAEDVHEQLMGLLGLSSKRAVATPMTPQQMQQMQQQQAAMMAQMQKQAGKSSRPPVKKDEDVNLVVNARRNSVLAHAPVDKMAIIQKAIEVIDVAPTSERSLLLNMNRMQTYHLELLDPAILVRTLQETGDLDPMTRLEVDSKNQTIIAYASLADHLTIRTVIDKLDGRGRQFEVIPLRRLDAEYVAGTVASMMGQEEEEKQDSRSRYYGMFGMRFGQSTEPKKPDKFRVDADVFGNRLLLWANETEIEEVTNLLVKLGEIPSGESNPDRVRVLDLEAGEDTARLLEQIRRTWPSLAPNALDLPVEQPPKAAPSDAQDDAPAEERGTEARRWPATADMVRFAQLRHNSLAYPEDDDIRPYSDPSGIVPANPATGADVVEDARDPAAKSGNPASGPQTPQAISPRVQITVGPDGRLVISSQDTAALDLLEELISQLSPPAKDYEMFSLKYASSFWVRMNLEDFFEEEDEEENRRFSPFFFGYPPEPKKQKPMGLSQRKPLKFIDDPDTNTILVVGADREQLATIQDLIQMWDVPPSTDSESARISAVFQIRYSRAAVIAEAIKEVYRDLLSANDKALQEGREQKRQPSGPSFIFGGGDDEPDRRTQVSFKGKLSLGIDEVSNTLLVSTEGQNLMENIRQMIEELDQAARPTAHVQVMTLRGDMNAARVREVLSEMLGTSVADGAATTGGPKPAGAPRNQPPGGNGAMTAPAPPR